MAITGLTVDLAEVARQAGLTVSEVEEKLALIKRGMEPVAKRFVITEDGAQRYYTVERRGVGKLKTPFGDFWHFDFYIEDRWKKYSVLVYCDELDHETLTPIFKDPSRLIIRTDSGCETGQVFHDYTCDCQSQLHLAMKTIAEAGEGVIVNIPRQDGRGMGLPFKLATLWLQEDLGVDTVQAASLISPNGDIDSRTYSGVIGVLRFFGIPESCAINLATNNPHKTQVFKENGYQLSDLVPVRVKPNGHTDRHLAAKATHLGHHLGDEDKKED